MTQELAIQIIRETLFTAVMIAAPMLLAGLIVGLTISLLQSVTQVNEMTLTFIPKIIAVVVVMILFMPWIMNRALLFANSIFNYISQMSH